MRECRQRLQQESFWATGEEGTISLLIYYHCHIAEIPPTARLEWCQAHIPPSGNMDLTILFEAGNTT
jgi:hypothetical protein